MSKDNKRSKKDEELNCIVDYCINNSFQYFGDREKNNRIYEGSYSINHNNSEKFNQEYRSTTIQRMINIKASFVTEALKGVPGKFFRVSKYNNKEAARMAKAATIVLNYYISKIPLAEKMIKIHKDAYKYGTAVLKAYHQSKDIKIPVQNMFLDKETLQNTITDQQPTFKQIRLNNFHPDPQSVDGTIDGCRWIVERELKTRKAIEANKEKFGLKNLEKAFESALPERGEGNSLDNFHKSVRVRDGQYDIESLKTRNDNAANSKDPISELITIYRPGTVQFMVNGVVVSDEFALYPGIRYPFVKITPIPEEGEFWGRAEPELSFNDVSFADNLTNMIKDQYLLHMKGNIFYDSTIIDEEDIEKWKKSEANEAIGITGAVDASVIQQWQADSPNPDVIAFRNFFENNIKHAMSINPLMDNESPGSNFRTDGTLSMFQQIGTTRVQSELSIIMDAWADLGGLLFKMAKIFNDGGLDFAVTGTLGDVTDDVLQMRDLPFDVKFDVRLAAGTDPERAARKARMINDIQIAQQMDQLGNFRYEEAIIEMAQYYDDWEDFSQYYITDPEEIQARVELSNLAAQAIGKQETSFKPRMTLTEVQMEAQQSQQQGGEMPMQQEGGLQ
jgi:hypothetical protein